jgi:methionyl-tRNA formyltransferase
MEGFMKIGVLASGDLGHHILEVLYKLYDLEFIATNQKSKEIIDLAAEQNVPVFIGNPREGRLLEFLEDKSCDIILSINYLYLIERDIVCFPKRYAINFHGSLLPKYRGRTPHVWAIIKGEKKCGITAHLIDEGCDTGPIIIQQEVEIMEDDTGQNILEKYKYLYPVLVKEVLSKVERNNIELTIQDETKATFFGKRTPSDGMIDWSWQTIRINNWVRAQSHPYPGAFTFYEGEKIIVDKIDVTTIEFEPLLKNGTIIKVVDNIPYVKTPNGIVKLSKIRNQGQQKFLENSVLK